LGRRVLKLSLCDPCLYLGEKIKFPCCRSPFPWGRKFKFKRLEIFLAFWCAQNRGLPRANFPIGEVILPLAKWNFKLKNLKVFFCMLQMVYKDFFCMMQMVYKEFKPLPYWDEPLLLGRHFLSHVFFQVSHIIFLLNMLHVTSEGFKPGLLFGLPLVGYHSIVTILATNCWIII
jgi:hypothetical protein